MWHRFPWITVLLYVNFVICQENRIITPFPSPKVLVKNALEDYDRYWGTYRPGLYFGTQVRHPTSPVTGLMWSTAEDLQSHFKKQTDYSEIRHWCEKEDGVVSFGWTSHDGRLFGKQTIREKNFKLETNFIKRPDPNFGGDWSVRIKIMPEKDQQQQTEVSIFYYIALNIEDTRGSLIPIKRSNSNALGSLKGNSDAIRKFQLSIYNVSGTVLGSSKYATMHLGAQYLKETLIQGLRLIEDKDKNYVELIEEIYDLDDQEKSPNFVAFQVTGLTPFIVDVVFESDSVKNRDNSLVGDILAEEIMKQESKFRLDFEKTFNLKGKKYFDSDIEFARAALSNLNGGIGFFYGSSRVREENSTTPLKYWNAPLYTATPSRSCFPRGFLWDEGFHDLLILKWDKEIAKDILAHWFDLMNTDGWIPREIILGAEARVRVPEHYVVQNKSTANPPTLLLTLHSMVKDLNGNLTEDDLTYFGRLWPRLEAWYNWFNTSQAGKLPSTYRWRGRDPKKIYELNPKTLTSGLDDYPRASHPTTDERHLDLRCWMTLAAGLMADIGNLIGKKDARYKNDFAYLSDNNLLETLHWSNVSQGFMDYGMHTDDVELKKLYPNSDKVRVFNSEPKLRFIDSFGYVSFFPLFLQIIDPQSPKLNHVLNDLRRTDLLWTPYGLRSLAKNSPYYDKYSTEHRAPYWRGTIWININYLAVKSLYYYSQVQGPNRELSYSMYQELRSNIITNIMNEYERTGYIWEHYDDKTGAGGGCKPFTGWSTLVVLMMNEDDKNYTTSI